MNTITELEQQARFLRNSGPREYDTFCAAFAKYTGFMVDSMVNATGELSVAQGRAQMCVKLQRMFDGVKNG